MNLIICQTVWCIAWTTEKFKFSILVVDPELITRGKVIRLPLREKKRQKNKEEKNVIGLF